MLGEVEFGKATTVLGSFCPLAADSIMGEKGTQAGYVNLSVLIEVQRYRGGVFC